MKMTDSTKELLRRPGVILALVATGLGVTACGDDVKVESGRVVEREHKEAYDWVYLQPIPQTNCQGTGDKFSCTTTYTYIPVLMHEPDRYKLVLEDCVQMTEDGGCARGTVEVDAARYEEYQVGEQYP